MLHLKLLTNIQRNVLFASIIGDGELTKLYPGSRRKNNSYREHYGLMQEEYRMWKAAYFENNFLYLTPKSQTLRSGSHPLFTELYSYFYNSLGQKRIPTELLEHCNLPHFLAVLYMDDGSLCISKAINHRNKRIYLTPHIFLYLQNYPLDQLLALKEHIQTQFNLPFTTSKRSDGYNYILRVSSTRDTYDFLNTIQTVTNSCPTMYYKTNWTFRFQHEQETLSKQFPGYEVYTSSPERTKVYSQEEVQIICQQKRNGTTDKEIAQSINRTYWSVVYKVRELRKEGILKA